MHRFRHALPLPSFSSVELERERGRGDILMNLSSLVVKSLYRFFFFPSTANLTHIQKYQGIITFLCSRSRETPSKFGITADKEDGRYMKGNDTTYILFPIAILDSIPIHKTLDVRAIRFRAKKNRSVRRHPCKANTKGRRRRRRRDEVPVPSSRKSDIG